MRLPFFRILLLAFALAATTGCAAVFRSSRVTVHVDSDPSGAQARIQDSQPRPTPADVQVDRSSTTAVVVTKPGYADHRGLVRKKLNTGWLVADIVTCAFPIALCIPLLVDAVSGAWKDVQPQYTAKLEPTVGTAPALAGGASSASPGSDSASPSVATPPGDMSESERKATARAAYIEGVQLQDKSDCAQALPKFEVAQKMFSAPTHLLHIAQCQVATGKLVEAQETYETLTRTSLAKDAPDVFRQAQDDARKDLPTLRARIPTLRVQVTPSPGSLRGLVVVVNGSAIPNELLGIARPVNPGKYKLEAKTSSGRSAPVELTVVEGAAQSVDLKVTK